MKTICIAGKNNIAVDVLKFVKDNYSQFDIFAICDACDDGQDTWQKSLRKHAHLMGVSEITLEVAQSMEDLLFISTEYDKIIKPSRFKTKELYNAHFSLLPKYKGMHICLLHILNGEHLGGVTFHKMDAGIDTGDIISQRKFNIDEHDSARDLYIKLIKTGTKLVEECIPNILAGKYQAKPQDYLDSSYNSKHAFSYSKFFVDMNQTAWNISRQIKAMCFREYQLPEVAGYKIFEYKITDKRSEQKPGTMLGADEFSMCFSTIDYDIILFKDLFSQAITAVIDDDVEFLKKIPFLSSYRNETYKNERLIDIAIRLNCKNTVKLLRDFEEGI